MGFQDLFEYLLITDNAVVERFFRILKSERTDYRRYATREEASQDIIDYISITTAAGFTPTWAT